MALIRFLDQTNVIRIGAVSEPVDTLAPPTEADIVSGSLIEGFRKTGEHARVKRLLRPVEPSAILGIGANYKGLFTGERPVPEYPVVFFKLANALQDPGMPIVLPRRVVRAEQVKFEGELCVVIGRGGKNIPEAEAMSHVYGYTIANDVSGTDWQRERVGMQWAMGKGFDTFCPIGPAMVPADEVGPPEELRIVTRVAGKVEQDEQVSELLFPIPRLISFLSAAHTIPDGSIILTGTPPGARFLVPGEEVSITIGGIGTLVNPVTEEE